MEVHYFKLVKIIYSNFKKRGFISPLFYLKNILYNILERDVADLGESVKLSLEDYRLNLVERLRFFETKYTILLIVYVFIPLLGLMAYMILGQPTYSLLIILLQILISEILTRRFG